MAKTSSTDLGSSLDDLTKNRFEKHQGVQSQTTGRYVPVTPSIDSSTSKPLSTASSVPSYAPSTVASSDASDSGYSTAYKTSASVDVPRTSSSAIISAPKRSDASKYTFGSASYVQSSGSMSDAEIMFGLGSTVDAGRKSSFDRSYSTDQYGRQDSSFGTSVDSEPVFGSSKPEYHSNRSLSLSSDNEGDFSRDQRITSSSTTSYRVYEGIQNAAFSDFESPSRNSNSGASSSSSPARKSTYADEDDYDLK